MDRENVNAADVFLFSISGIFHIQGRGSVVTGRLNSELRRGDPIEIRDGLKPVFDGRALEIETLMGDIPPSHGEDWPVGIIISRDRLSGVKEGHDLWRAK